MKSWITRLALGRAGGGLAADVVAAGPARSASRCSSDVRAMPPSPPPERQRNSRRDTGVVPFGRCQGEGWFMGKLFSESEATGGKMRALRSFVDALLSAFVVPGRRGDRREVCVNSEDRPLWSVFSERTGQGEDG